MKNVCPFQLLQPDKCYHEPEMNSFPWKITLVTITVSTRTLSCSFKWGGGAPADLFIFHTLYYLFIHLFIHYWLIGWFNGFFLIISIISCILWFFFFRICHTAVWCKSLKCISKFQCHYLYHYILFDIIFSSKHRLKL